MNLPGTAARVWRVPALLALSTSAGLLAGLLGDGAWDALGWCALGLPVAVALRCLRRPAGVRAVAVSSPSRARRL